MGCKCSKDTKENTTAPIQSGQTSNDSPKHVAEAVDVPSNQDQVPSQQKMAEPTAVMNESPVVEVVVPVVEPMPAQPVVATGEDKTVVPALRGKSGTAWLDAVEDTQGANESYEAYHSADSEEQRISEAAKKQEAIPKKSNNKPRKKKGGRN